MSYHAPSRCPVCSRTMELTRLRCEACGTELTGRFAPCRFCLLDEKHMTFVEAFLRCRGSIKEVEKMLGVSYPTVRNMMDAALSALGWGEGSERPSERDAILTQMAAGEIDVTEAIEKLKKL